MSILSDLGNFITHEVDNLKQDLDKLSLKFDALKAKHDIKSLDSTTRSAVETAAKEMGTYLNNIQTAIKAAQSKAEKDTSSS